MSVCRYCARRVRWVDTESDRRMALDASPNPAGNVVMSAGRARVLSQADTHTGTRWMPHAATCPDAGSNRRARSR